MKKHLAMLALATLTVACNETAHDPTSLSPNYSMEDAAGAPAGRGNCNAQPLRDLQKGRLTPGSCNFNEAAGRRSAYYEFDAPAAGQMLSVRFTGDFAPLIGVKESTKDVTVGTVWAAFNWDAGDVAGFSFVGADPTHQIFITNRFANTLGTFTLTSSVEAVSYSCEFPFIYQAPFTLTQQLDADHACNEIIQFSPFPEAIGKPILSQYYYGKLEPGHTYEIVVSGMSPEFSPGLTIFSGGQVAAQDVGPVGADGVRRVTITPTHLSYYTIEVSSGHPDGQGNWVTPAGSYTLSTGLL